MFFKRSRSVTEDDCKIGTSNENTHTNDLHQYFRSFPSGCNWDTNGDRTRTVINLCCTFHTASEQGLATEQHLGKKGCMPIFQVLELFQVVLMGLSMTFSPGHRLSQCKRFLHNIDHCSRHCPGSSQCDYSTSSTAVCTRVWFDHSVFHSLCSTYFYCSIYRRTVWQWYVVLTFTAVFTGVRFDAGV